MLPKEIQEKWMRLIDLLQRETWQGGIIWTPLTSHDSEGEVAIFRSSHHDFTYAVSRSAVLPSERYALVIRDESGKMAGAIHTDEHMITEDLRHGIHQLWTVIADVRSPINKLLDRAIDDLASLF